MTQAFHLSFVAEAEWHGKQVGENCFGGTDKVVWAVTMNWMHLFDYCYLVGDAAVAVDYAVVAFSATMTW